MDKVYYDSVNLKEFAETITNYLSINNSKRINNVRKYYGLLLECIDADIKDSFLNRILKYLSSTSKQVITIIDDINNGIYDKELKKFVDILLSELLKTVNFDSFLKKINESINIPFLTVDEYCDLSHAFEKKDYELYLLILIKHTFKTYKISLPNISSQRMLEEALTIYFDTEFQLKLINESAKLGNSQAIVLFGNLVYSDLEKSLKYYLMAKKNKIALWEIGYILETKNISQDLIDLIKKELDFCFEENPFINNIEIDENINNAENMKYAIQIYYYICSNFGYSKAYTSIGKLLLNGVASYNNDEKKTNEYIKMYLNEAIKLGNINALRFLADYFRGNPSDVDYNETYVMEMLRKSADMGEIDANYEYGMLLKDKNIKLARKYITYAAEQKNASACFELAQMNELKSNYKDAVFYYKKAIYYGKVDAVYDLCMLYIELADISGQKIYIHKAKQFFNKYKKLLSSDIIEKINEIILK